MPRRAAAGWMRRDFCLPFQLARIFIMARSLRAAYSEIIGRAGDREVAGSRGWLIDQPPSCLGQSSAGLIL